MKFYANYVRNRVVFGENLHSWHKFYTTTGRDGCDKSQFCMRFSSRQSFVDSLIASALNSSMLEQANLSKQAIVFAMYKAMVAGYSDYDEVKEIRKKGSHKSTRADV